jgi:DNA modification methylase
MPKKFPIQLAEKSPYYQTKWGHAYLGDAIDLLKLLPGKSVSLVITSPPFALRKKKNYGNPDADKYVRWFRPFAREVHRVLKDNGSFVVEIGGAWNPGHPTRSIYHYQLLIDLVKKVKFHLAQEFFWFNPAKMPGPAQWVTIERVRCTDAVNTVWWLSKTESPNADNRRVPQKYSESMKRLLRNGYNAGKRPSGHFVSDKWQKDLGGAIPKNLLSISNTSSSDSYQRACRQNEIPLHPARFPHGLPKFFIEFLTEKGDLVADIFAGSNVTGAIAESLDRYWIAFEQRQDFFEASKYRFDLPVDVIVAKTDPTKKEMKTSKGE